MKFPSLNSSTTGIAIGTMLLFGAFNSYSNTCEGIPRTQRVVIREDSSTPKLIAYSKKTWVDEAKDIFPEASGFTREEADLYHESLFKLFKPTGENFFDL